jgi:hypothetical protein
MSHHEFTRRLGWFMTLVGSALVIVIAGWTIFAAVAFIAYIGSIVFLVTRESTPTDEYCAQVDIDLDRERDRQRKVRRLARQQRRWQDGGRLRG